MKRFALFALVMTFAALMLQVTPLQEAEAQKGEEKLTRAVPVATENMARAVAGLLWLADHQSDGGYWNPEFFHEDSLRKEVGAEVSGLRDTPFARNSLSMGKLIQSLGGGRVTASESITAMAILAFLETGSVPNVSPERAAESGPFQETLFRAVGWLISRQEADGCLSKRSWRNRDNTEVWAYNHALAMLALSEVYSKAPEEGTAMVLQAAVKFAKSIVNEKAKGWGYRPKSSSVDVALTGLMSLAMAKAASAGVPGVFDDGFDKKLDAWLKGYEGTEENGFLVAAGNQTSSLLPTSWPNTPVPTVFALLARGELDGIPSGGSHARAMVQNLYQSAHDANDEPFFAAFAPAAMHRIAGIQSIKFLTACGERLRNSQRGYLDSEISKYRGSGSLKGRHSLDEHGSWDPTGKWGKLGGRPMATAANVLALVAVARMKNETIELKSSQGAESKLVPWDGDKAALPGSKVDELIAGFWQAAVLPLGDMRINQRNHMYAERNGAVEQVESMEVQRIFFTEDIEKFTPSVLREDGTFAGQPAIEYKVVGKKVFRIFLPLTCTEWEQDKKSGIWQQRFKEQEEATLDGDATGLNGPNDPRYPWNDIVSNWFYNIDIAKLNWANRCGLALWIGKYYPRFQWAKENDAGQAVWNGYAEEILMDSLPFGGCEIENLQFVASYLRDDPALNNPGTIYYHDTFLTEEQTRIREQLVEGSTSFLSWYDKEFAAGRAKQLASIKNSPLKKKDRDELRELRKSDYEKAREEAILGK